MRISTMLRISARADPDTGLIDRVTDLARRTEAAGFRGIWLGDLHAVLKVFQAAVATGRGPALGFEARQRLRQLEDMDFDEVLIGSHYGGLEDLERVRGCLGRGLGQGG